MERNEARQEVKRRIDCRTYLKKARNGGYCCPACGSGTRKGGTGAVKYYSDTNTWYCHECNTGGDNIDLYMYVYGVDNNTAFSLMAQELNITIDPYTGNQNDDRRTEEGYKEHRAKKAQQAAQSDAQSPEDVPEDKTSTDSSAGSREGTEEPTVAGEGTADFTAYYKACWERLSDPAAVEYLQARGISLELAKKYWIGYDPAADPASVPGAMGNEYKPHPCPRIIIPTSKNHYVARSIDPTTPAGYAKLNPDKKRGGGAPGIFNAKAVYKSQEPVFIVEGAFDALSIMQAGGVAIALNSTSNADVLLKKLEQKKPGTTFIICLDNDAAGKKATEVIEEGLSKLEINHITADICAGFKDPNETLIYDRTALEEAVKEAKQRVNTAGLKGLLTYQDAVHILETADDRYLELKAFPLFSKMAKIRVHSSVVLAADTGAGKSSLAINFLDNLNEDYPCIYINLEMDMVMVLRRLIAIHSGLEIDRIEGYKNDPRTAELVKPHLRGITNRKPLQIIQAEDAYTVEKISNIVESSTRGREEPTIVIIDHSLLVNTQKDNGDRYKRFTDISEALRRLSLKTNIILFILLQQSRQGKAVEEDRPKNSSLKESGSWENDATHICFLWFDPADRKKKLLLTKNRGGQTGEVILNYSPESQIYTEAPESAQSTAARAAASGRVKTSRRDKQKQKLIQAYQDASLMTFGKPTVKLLAEAADVTTSTIKSWIREYGGCTIDGKPVDPAGIDAEVEYTGFVKLTPSDGSPFEEEEPGKIRKK